MPVLFMPLAAGSVAASSSASINIQPYFVFIFIGVVLVSSFLRAANNKRRNGQASRQHQAPPRTVAHPQTPHQNMSAPSGRAGVAHHTSDVPYTGTLLNGVPLKDYDGGHGHQTTGFANERMRAEAELKRQLDALDAARRNGQVDADQYAMHREAIFKNF